MKNNDQNAKSFSEQYVEIMEERYRIDSKLSWYMAKERIAVSIGERLAQLYVDCKETSKENGK